MALGLALSVTFSTAFTLLGVPSLLSTCQTFDSHLLALYLLI